MKAPGLHGASRPFRQDWLGARRREAAASQSEDALEERRRGGPRLERGVVHLADQSRENLGFVRTHEPALSLATRTGGSVAAKSARM